jgi:hypothetical protein
MLVIGSRAFGYRIIWSLATVTLNRSFLSIRRAEVKVGHAPRSQPSENRSVFGLVSKRSQASHTSAPASETPIQLTRIVETQSWDDK